MKQSLPKGSGDRNPKVIITFRIGGENGGPYVSHQRILSSCLRGKYNFIPLMLFKPKVQLRPREFLKLIQRIRNEKPDIIHFAGLQMEGFIVLLAAKLAGCRKTVCAIHGSSMDAIDFRGWKKKTICEMENWTMRNASVCYGVSEFVSNWPRVKKYAKEYAGHVYNLPDPCRKQGNRSKIRDEFGIEEDKIVVVSTGRIIKDKGYEVLLRAILAEKESWENVYFLIVGEGSYLSEMKEQIIAAELEECVLFTGYRADIPDILSAADIFVICTLHETLCNSVVEASSQGLPVVATRTGGIPEIVSDGESGILIEPYDYKGVSTALKQLIMDAELRNKMGSRGEKIIRERFSEQNITNKIDKIYDKLLSPEATRENGHSRSY